MFDECVVVMIDLRFVYARSSLLRETLDRDAFVSQAFPRLFYLNTWVGCLLTHCSFTLFVFQVIIVDMIDTMS